MDRDLEINAMVNLPRLNGSSAVVLGEQLLTTAEAEKGAGLPVFIERPRERLAAAVAALTGRLQPREATDTKVRVAADRDLDGAWRSFSEWLGALAGMPDGSFAELPRARTLNTLAFSEGLSFIALSFREEWTQSEARLKAMADGGFEPLIATLGGTPFLTHLKNAHTRYGEVLGIKAPVKMEQSPEVLAYLLALIAAIKTYVVKVVAYVDPEEPGSEALSAALLLPLVQWKDTPSRPNPPADAEAADDETADS